MKIGVTRESCPGENRVALVPAVLPALAKAGMEILLEPNAGLPAGFPDSEYADKGARVLKSRSEVFAEADILPQVRSLGSNPRMGKEDLAAFRKDHVVLGMMDPLSEPSAIGELASKGVTGFAMELIPRITRAQSMDVLSSMATVAGYKAVLLAAAHLPRMFPMMMTAAGTISPARVFVIGAGVAGLQAIASAKRLGAVVEGYDVRPAVKEQVESLGAKFVELELETGGSEDKGGYAKAQDEDFYRRQRELMARVVAENDVVITTAAIPGKKSPVLVTEDMVKSMRPGSVIVDLAAERGGNCELTEADQTVVKYDVTLLGPTNLPATVPYHASQMYAKNMTNLLLHLVKEGRFAFDLEDAITRDTLVCRGGEVVSSRIREQLGLPAPTTEGSNT